MNLGWPSGNNMAENRCKGRLGSIFCWIELNGRSCEFLFPKNIVASDVVLEKVGQNY